MKREKEKLSIIEINLINCLIISIKIQKEEIDLTFDQRVVIELAKL